MSEIIPFPKLEEKLRKDINENVDIANYELAYDQMNEYESYFTLSPELAITKCDILWQLNAYLELKEEAHILLMQGYQPYDALMTYYIKSLYELEQYHDVVELVNQVIDEVASHKTRLTFLPLKDQAQAKLAEREDYMAFRIQKFNSLSLHEQTQLILALIDDHAYQFVSSFVYLLTEESITPTIQSLILEYLRLARYNQSVMFSKLSKSLEVIPSNLPGIDHSLFKQEVIPRVIESLEEQAPSLVHEASVHLNTQNIILYPIDIEAFASTSGWVETYVQYFLCLTGQGEFNQVQNQDLLQLINSLNT
ncbi:hypothetical protein [Staphylococcus sp. 11261D007BR]